MCEKARGATNESEGEVFLVYNALASVEAGSQKEEGEWRGSRDTSRC